MQKNTALLIATKYAVNGKIESTQSNRTTASSAQSPVINCSTQTTEIQDHAFAGRGTVCRDGTRTPSLMDPSLRPIALISDIQ